MVHAGSVCCGLRSQSAHDMASAARMVPLSAQTFDQQDELSRWTTAFRVLRRRDAATQHAQFTPTQVVPRHQALATFAHIHKIEFRRCVYKRGCRSRHEEFRDGPQRQPGQWIESLHDKGRKLTCDNSRLGQLRASAEPGRHSSRSHNRGGAVERRRHYAERGTLGRHATRDEQG